MPVSGDTFRPTEVWDLDMEFSEPVDRARFAMNAQDPRALIHGLKKQVVRSETGIALAVLKGENPGEYSNSEALVVFNPFANGPTPNMLVRAEFVRQVAQNSDLRDTDDKLKPVIMLASPGLRGSKLHLTPEEQQGTRRGRFEYVASQLLHAVSERDVGKVTLLGFSQAADITLAGGTVARGANLDVQGIAAGDPVGVEDRGKFDLGHDFRKASLAELKKTVAASGIHAQRKAHGKGLVEPVRFVVSALYPANRAGLYPGLGVARFNSMANALLIGPSVGKFVIGYGGNDAITKPECIEPAMQQLYDEHGPDSFTSIRVDGANHTWGDHLPMLGEFFMRAAV